MANESRTTLPQIKAAYDAGDREKFSALTTHWLHRMQLLERSCSRPTNTFYSADGFSSFHPGHHPPRNSHS